MVQHFTKLHIHEQQCDHSGHHDDNILQDIIAEGVEEEMELKPDLHVQLQVDEDNNKHAGLSSDKTRVHEEEA